MSKKTVEINQCDECDYNPKDPLACVAIRTCEVCRKDYRNNSKHNGDTYRASRHMRDPFTSFVCAHCWALLDYNGYRSGTSPLPKGDIDLHASGSTMAINVAEFREYIQDRYAMLGQQAVIEMLRAIHEGKQIKFDLEDEKRKLDEKYKAELDALKDKKYNEVVSL